jgi:oligoribonuclease NrnB/cAMP/cGMP phosphodiesterase (DHH superfamily)
MSGTLIYYHDDLDGMASAAIIASKEAFIDGQPNEVDMIGYDYVDDSVINLTKAGTYDKVYVVDMALQPFTRMLELARVAKVIWIDHHFGAISEYHKLDDATKGLFHDVYLGGYHNMKSACELTYEYFNPGVAVPKGIKNISRVDTWHHNDNGEVWAYFEYCDYVLHNPANISWWNVINDEPAFYSAAVADGDMLRKYRRFKEDQHAMENAMEVEFEGHKCIALNSDSLGSSQFDRVYDSRKHKMMIRFSRAKGAWKFSIYTTHDTFDVSVIAKKYGGGGHRKASGFVIRTDELPFKLG